MSIILFELYPLFRDIGLVNFQAPIKIVSTPEAFYLIKLNVLQA